ncbi:MAG: AAA family ATPase [Zymomonas mobilis]|uniref:AAA family ATPase n=1 Tax=Zymomonas mobilis TaxID=542 RepID=UPI0039E92BDF
MKVYIVSYEKIPEIGKNEVYLNRDNWNDYSFVTLFGVTVFDENGKKQELPDVRIGFIGQTTFDSTYSKLHSEFSELEFECLPEGFFSLGVNVNYYKNLYSKFSEEWTKNFLTCLKDVVWDQNLLEKIKGEKVFQKSHIRSTTIRDIQDNYASVLKGDVLLTDFDFNFFLPASDEMAEFDLEFKVKANSTPSTNIHALIGRNGVGKTTLLNSMVKAIVTPEENGPFFYDLDIFMEKSKLQENYFSSLVSVAFSVFDPFDPPKVNEKGRYSYIGLNHYTGEDGAILKSKQEIFDEFVDGLSNCFKDEIRKNRWIKAIETLKSDQNFCEMNFLSLEKLTGTKLKDEARSLISKMSSGHAIVIIIMTLLVSKVNEKTIVLIDEPETHLHPPLLSALMRSLSQLLHNRNAVAIIATHSPVVLQEIPKSCVWKVFRSLSASEKKRPDTETFGENVGILTREVFGLEVERSGFHTVLSNLVEKGGSYNDILNELGDALGYEAQGILRAMVINRDESLNNEEA